MFKHKGFFVKVVPDPQSKQNKDEDRPRPDYQYIQDRAVNNLAKLMATYILTDTIRKVVVHTAESKIR